MKKITFDEFYEEFLEQNSMVSADHNGMIYYTWRDKSQTVELITLTGMLTPEQITAMFERGAWWDVFIEEEIMYIIDETIECGHSIERIIESLDYTDLLRHVFDSEALADAEASQKFKTFLQEWYDEICK